jgi:hypothetical protein
MHRKRSRDGRRSGVHGRNSGGVHWPNQKIIQKIFQREWSRSVSENQGEIEGEIKWQQASKVAWSTRKSNWQ